MSTRFFTNRRDNTLIEYFGRGVEFTPSAAEDLPEAPPVGITPDIIISESFV